MIIDLDGEMVVAECDAQTLIIRMSRLLLKDWSESTSG